ncbi:MAG: TetR/AcrR family transcriptional regulator [Planctomycetales bacterium]|nr:TetR/AcrR family transcriptional regulator [Planctomycetales bacterium]
MPEKKKRGVERKPIFLPIITDAFVEQGYRGTTTADLARRCNVRENELYRIWPSKKQMFLDSIDYVFEVTREHWQQVLDSRGDERSDAERILDFQSRDHGKMRLYRIVFAGLTESDDKEIRASLRKLYRKFYALLFELVSAHRSQSGHQAVSDESTIHTVWSIIGIGTIVDIQRELGLLSKSEREQFMRRTAGMFLQQ